MEIQFDGVIWKESNSFVAYCPELDVSSCGDSVDEARRMLKEAVTLFIEEADRMGTLEQILKEAGYKPKGASKKGIWDAPRIVSTERMEIQVR